MKFFGQEFYNYEQIMCDIIFGFLDYLWLVCFKVIYVKLGEIMGYCIWGFCGFVLEEMLFVFGRM